MIATGIRNVAFQSVTVNGSIADVHMTFTACSIGLATMPNGQVAPFSPHNDMIADLALIGTGAGWRVLSTNTNFAPGSEP